MKLHFLGLLALLNAPESAVGFGTISRPAAYAVPRGRGSSSTSLSASGGVPFYASTSTDESADAAKTANDGDDDVDGATTTTTAGGQQRRPLGGQELLMLPRQYLDSNFPSMSHVSVALLSKTPPVENLERALEEVLRSHPLLRSTVEGSGEPDERIDAFNMVRRGDPDPLTFVERPPGTFSGRDVLTVVKADDGGGGNLEDSWKSAFRHRLDHGIESDGTNPLWNAELHAGGGG
eukprot:CAMPEP_0113570290 /NCGR_PEP_ID=MMETSP0015_2-20120614/24885_1 /TAXON_ID=2838 /ORGANISM="Odontella" /LENGTH=234 /DNA_ID=CAMNT_0000473051 /DNA_START=122 /DNA_END=822 /DNA_ORIENTATION=- /assembly_acc=CAM_ASM_000160